MLSQADFPDFCKAQFSREYHAILLITERDYGANSLVSFKKSFLRENQVIWFVISYDNESGSPVLYGFDANRRKAGRFFSEKVVL